MLNKLNFTTEPLKNKNISIVGAGFYGLMLGIFLSKHNKVTIYESDSDVMTQASSLCQMRIHTGMMYPRNIKTALSCMQTFKPFMLKFKDAIIDDFKSIYAVAKDSKISADDFYDVQKSLGQSIKKIPNEFFDNNLIQGVYECNEFTFDPLIIKKILLDKCYKHKVKILLNYKINNLNDLYNYDHIYMCNYSGINELLISSNLEPLDLVNKKFEKIFARDNLGNTSVCVVDGNYFSSMVLPNSNIKTYTSAELSEIHTLDNITRFNEVFNRVKTYIPEIKLEYIKSQFGYKTIFNNSISRNCYIQKVNPKTTVILGGKITNVFELFKELAL